MTRVALVAGTWVKLVDVEIAGDIIDAEGMSWERRGLNLETQAAIQEHDIPPGVPLYVPSVGA